MLTFDLAGLLLRKLWLLLLYKLVSQKHLLSFKRVCHWCFPLNSYLIPKFMGFAVISSK